MSSREYDVIVVGAGNAGLTAALAAHEAGARVLLLEAAGFDERGGNSRFAGGIFRAVHDGLDSITPILHPSNEQWLHRVTVAPYSSEQYTKDWTATSQGFQDRELMRVTIDRSFETLQWMQSKGVEWELTADKLIDPDKQPDGTLIAVPPGGAIRSLHEGVGLVDRLFAAVEATDIEVWYDSPAADLITSGSSVEGVRVRHDEEFVDVYGTVVLASGGFEANPEMRLRYLGPGWDLVKVRGTRFNQGTMLTKSMLAGAQPAGHWGGAHAVPLDAAAPQVGDLRLKDKTSRYSYPYALLVDRDGQRFIDEGEAQVFLTYAKTGWAIRAQPGAMAYQIFDQKTIHLLEPRYSTGTPVIAESLAELAGMLGISAEGLQRTVDDFNAATATDAEARFDPFSLDGVRADPVGQPPKSNWAQRIEQGPFVCYPVTCGITFTYGGLQIDRDAQVHSTEGKPMPGLYATGEITGGFFYHNYGAGAGLMRGAVFGRIAGTKAARHAEEQSASRVWVNRVPVFKLSAGTDPTSDPEPVERLGFIGLGVMGSAQCANLIRKSGYPVTVFDVAADAVRRAVDLGAEAAVSAADVGAKSDVIFLSLPGGPQVDSVLLGAGGVFDTARPGTVIVDLSTTPVELAKRAGAEAARRGLWFVDAPVARTRQAAIDGTLSITLGGADHVVATVTPLLRTLATDILHCGPNGAGALMKIVNNMVVFETVVAIAEALTLVRRSGLVDPELAFQALSNGSAASFTLANHGRKALLPDVHAEGIFPAEYMKKDLSYALAAAADLDTTLPAATLAHELLARTCKAGYAKSYHTAVVRIIEGGWRD